MKRPAFQFYPGDWQHDAKLRSCSVAARGCWLEMICIMHQADPYGHLRVNGNALSVDVLARMIGAAPKEVKVWLVELESAGVFDRDSDGAIVSRRMVRDEAIRESRAAGGKLGGNPNLKSDSKVSNKVNLNTTIEVNQKETPSSSSSSSSSTTTQPSVGSAPQSKTGSRLPENWVLPDAWRNEARRISDDLRCNINTDLEASKFADHWHAQPGQKGRKSDWLGTWRNWIRKACEFSTQRQGPINRFEAPARASERPPSQICSRPDCNKPWHGTYQGDELCLEHFNERIGLRPRVVGGSA